MDRLYTSRAFQRYQEHPNWSSYDKVMTLRSSSKNRGLQQRRDVAETEHPDVATLLHDIATFEVGFGWNLAHFEPIMDGFKPQTVGIEEEDDLERFVFDVFEGEQAPFW